MFFSLSYYNNDSLRKVWHKQTIKTWNQTKICLKGFITCISLNWPNSAIIYNYSHVDKRSKSALWKKHAKPNSHNFIITLVTAWKKAAFPSFCRWRFITDSIRLFSLSICLLFSSSFNLTFSNWDPMIPVSLVLSGKLNNIIQYTILQLVLSF